MFILDSVYELFLLPSMSQFPRRKDLNAHIVKTLLDGEMITDEVNGQIVPRYLVYDIVKFEVCCCVIATNFFNRWQIGFSGGIFATCYCQFLNLQGGF